jgi:hypothetical protein
MPADRQEPIVSVIIPCYNEARNLERGVLDEVYGYLAGQAFPWEVVVVNDESTDSSKSLIQHAIQNRPDFSLHDIPHGGKPAAIWAGIQRARGEMILFTDMDQSTPIHELDKLLPWYREGFDVVIGSRQATREGSSAGRCSPASSIPSVASSSAAARLPWRSSPTSNSSGSSNGRPAGRSPPSTSSSSTWSTGSVTASKRSW